MKQQFVTVSEQKRANKFKFLFNAKKLSCSEIYTIEIPQSYEANKLIEMIRCIKEILMPQIKEMKNRTYQLQNSIIRNRILLYDLLKDSFFSTQCMLIAEFRVTFSSL